jgi:hypothetical protein
MMEHLVAALMIWIISVSDYSELEQPEVTFSNNLCAEMGMPTIRHCPYGGRYIPELNKIILSKHSWEDGDPLSEAVLVHELVHYFQDQIWDEGLYDGVHPSLRCKAEKEAYNMQARYLIEKYNMHSIQGIPINYFRNNSIKRVCQTAWLRWRRQNPVTP